MAECFRNNFELDTWLCKDPEKKVFKNKDGKEIVYLNFPVSYTNGKRGDDKASGLINVSASGWLAQTFDGHQDLKKGAFIRVSGKLLYNPYKAKDGSERATQKLLANELIIRQTPSQTNKSQTQDKDADIDFDFS